MLIVLPFVVCMSCYARCIYFQCYGQPYSKEQEAIDSIRQPDTLFQMTVSPSKTVQLAGLTAAVAGMTTAAPVNFYIVVLT